MCGIVTVSYGLVRRVNGTSGKSGNCASFYMGTLHGDRFNAFHNRDQYLIFAHRFNQQNFSFVCGSEIGFVSIG